MKNLKILLVLTGILMCGCVPPQKFKEVNTKSNKLESERDQLMKENEQLNVENTEMKAKMTRAENEQERYREDSLRYEEELDKIEKDYSILLRKYNDLEATHDALLQGTARESRRLLNELQTAQGNLDVKERRLRELESTVNSERQNLTKLRAELEARNARLAEMQKILDRKDSAVNALKESVSRALMGFEGQGLSVQLKNGKVYVSLDEKLLFSTGSTVVDP